MGKQIETVFVLLNKNHRISAIYATQAQADAKCQKFNADPELEPGTPDPDYPYTVEPWGVSDP